MSDTLEMKVRRLLLRKGIEFDPSIEQIVDATACVLGHRTEPSPPAQPSGPCGEIPPWGNKDDACEMPKGHSGPHGKSVDNLAEVE